MDSIIETGAVATDTASFCSSEDQIQYTLDPHAADSWWASRSRTAGTARETQAKEGSSDGQPLLFVLRVIQHYNIRMFRLDSQVFSSSRATVGAGATSVVEQSAAPRENYICPLYREPTRLAHSSLPLAGIYTDDHNVSWDPQTMMAYKKFKPSDTERIQRRISGLVTELQVVYYPGLRGHPNIIRPLGVSWAAEEDLISTPSRKLQTSEPPQSSESNEAQPKRSWPIVITERSSEQSITKLMQSRAYRYPVASVPLYVKFRLCMDALRGLKAMHQCDIAHCDVKCDNVVVSTTDEGTARNWRARLCDFNLSILRVSSLENYTTEDVKGTPLYTAPELLLQGKVSSEDVFKTDVYSWGLLLWEVVIDGGARIENAPHPFIDEHGQLVSEEVLQDAKSKGKIHEIAAASCKKYLLSLYGASQSHLIELIQQLIHKTLQKQAGDRSTASDLLDFVTSELQEIQPSHTEPGVPRAHLRKKDEKIFPQFDLRKMYYYLLPFSRLPRVIIKELESLEREETNVPQEHILEAKYQLALCHAAGFGGAHDPELAVSRLAELAEVGYVKAQLSIKPMATGLGVSMPPRFCQQLGDRWTGEPKDESMSDRSAFPTICSSTLGDTLRHRLSTSAETLPPLLQAANEGNAVDVKRLLDEGTDVNTEGSYGETALHHVALCSRDEAKKIVADLLAHGLKPDSRSRKALSLCENDPTLLTIDEGTTAFELSLLNDNAPVVESFIQHSPQDLLTFQTVVLACESLSLNSLKIIIRALQVRGQWSDMLIRTKNGCTLIYWALRPDLFRHLQLMSRSAPAVHATTLVKHQCNVIWELRAAGCSWDTHEKDLFSAAHLLAAYGQPKMLELFLSHPDHNDKASMVNHKSRYGWTPIRDAMVWGRKDNFDVLLRHGALLGKIEEDLHAAHVCAKCEPEPSVEFAREIQRRDIKAHKRKTRGKETPLHFAGTSGEEELIKFWLQSDADPLVYDKKTLTPLGRALVSRNFKGVRALQEAHVLRELPLVGAKPHFVYTSSLGATNTTLAMLLSPGIFSPSKPSSRRSVLFRQGCTDVDWCDASQQIFEVLLDGYQERSRWGINFLDTCLRPPDGFSGISCAVRLGNTKAVEELVKANKFEFEYRELLQIACDQLHLGPEHPRPLSQRYSLVETLRSLQRDHYKKSRDAHCDSRFAFLWKLYYFAHGDREQAIYLRCMEWQTNNRFKAFRPVFAEFLVWPRFRHSFEIVQGLFVQCLLLPIIISTALLGSRGNLPRNPDKIPLLVSCYVISMVLSQWPVVNRFLSVEVDLFLELYYFEEPAFGTLPDSTYDLGDGGPYAPKFKD
ncbi:Dual specificity protein kinase shkC [Paramyrothecium foliicola]|nr:Dual specificity protein kinase shkC [Paramyrothecium foliicola]